jgi:hypothetical protein
MGSGGRAGTLADGSGKLVTLHGVSESGTENYCLTAGTILATLSPMTQASLSAMQSWGINTVRIPLNEDCWLGINGVGASVSGANYQSAIQTAVDLITQNGMYTILDLHSSAAGTTQSLGQVCPNQGCMPDVDHSVTFWQEVATAYKNNGSVAFDLFNEPNTGGDAAADWGCWLNGSTAPSSGACPMMPFAVAGMQTLLDTVRATGATNLVLLGGMGDAWNLGLWAKNAPEDKLSPPNIAASWHFYSNNVCYNGACNNGNTGFYCPPNSGNGAGVQAVMEAGYPIVVGETGIDDNDKTDGGQTWWPGFLGWLDAQGLSYLAWSWSAGNSPQLITEATNFTPTTPEGVAYQKHLQCLKTGTISPAKNCTDSPTEACQ